ncbi:dihydrodipicolinate synthase family protein [Jiella sonneratiae]|uniref:Dihydrodipicolinate synthase family protein n=1 Tax=Jiella sonneratiae TaxID=2816856 RepID=A0ABS3J3N6_9HYPH|nr:dihydrodipicolinate synthase family protein [Jiella sonneratiae]MBO0904274.1 dihydrodipicolinate synthase family protein [Jiella sonneratiae]
MNPEPSTSRLADALFVPVLTHYAPGAAGTVDLARMLAHIRHIRPQVRQVMLAGSTGDGWELDDAAFDALIDLAASPEIAALDLSLLFGALRPTTDAVIARLERLEQRLGQDPALARRVAGAVVCPPVDREASQAAILSHYDAVFAACRLPIAVYQLPQVTLCRIEPETMARLSQSPRVPLFKDSSGEDLVAKSGLGFAEVALVRGAEGGYVEALKPAGPYDGWLLSTGNALADPLRRLLALKAEGRGEEADALSADLSQAVAAIFAAAKDEGGANAFSNANRAMDHIAAHGRHWPEAPLPLKVDGTALSERLVRAAADLAGAFLPVGGAGYQTIGEG